MLYKKNLPVWQRIVRVLGALVMASCAFHYGKNIVGFAFGIAAIVTIVTGMIGYCPLCSIGKKPGIA